MIQMVTGMKQFARGFKEQFKKDEKVIEHVGNQQAKNQEKTDAEVDKIAYYRILGF